MSRITKNIALCFTLLLAFAACGDDEPGATGTTQPTSGISTPEYLAFRDLPVACGAEVPPPAQDLSFGEPNDMGVEGPVTAVIHTSCGAVTLELDPALAPETVNSFVFLAEQGYFDGSVSHRVYPGFMIQAGDPTATGRGGPGYDVPDEFPPADAAYERGIVAMANAGVPNSGGSQFFMMLADYPLPPAYSIFGRIVEGMDVLDRIAMVPLTTQPGSSEVSRPLEAVFIERVEIQR